MTGDRTVDLWQGRDARGTRSIWATLHGDGRLMIEGQDLGPQVEVFGAGLREYVWAWTAQPGDVARIVELLGGQPGDDPVALLQGWMRQNKDHDPGNFLKHAGATLEFWSRIGD